MFQFPGIGTDIVYNNHKLRFRRPSKNIDEIIMIERCQQRIMKRFKTTSYYSRHRFTQDRPYSPIKITFTSVRDIEIIEMSNTGDIINVDRWKRIGGGFL